MVEKTKAESPKPETTKSVVVAYCEKTSWEIIFTNYAPPTERSSPVLANAVSSGKHIVDGESPWLLY